MTVRTRLIRIQLIVALAVMLVCTLAFIFNDIMMFRRALERNTHSVARVLGRSVIPTIAFMDPEEAKKSMSALSMEPAIESAYLFDSSDKIFSSYGIERPLDAWPEFKDHYLRYKSGHLELFYKLYQNKDFIGTLVLRANTGVLNQEYLNYAIIVLSVLLAGIALSLLLSNYNQASFSRPIIRLANVAKKIYASGDYSLRIGSDEKELGIEEIEVLSREFDRMLEEIQGRNKTITEINLNLEQKVETRTNELREVQKIALQNAHAAGMAQVSTEVLHNIGNVVNSANVSVAEISKTIKGSRLSGLLKANDLIERNKTNLGSFLTDDPSGRLVPTYLREVGEAIHNEHQEVLNETQNLAKKIVLIKEVVGTQQSFARGDLMTEEIDLKTLVLDILEMQKSALARHHIEIKTEFEPIPLVYAQKIKFSHILLNLIKNAKESMDCVEIGKRTLKIKIQLSDDKQNIFVKIIDSGEGIKRENLEKIFTHGFTTKKFGHGFGLHFCANAMKEMKGEIQVQSDGLGQGAEFVMIFNTQRQDTFDGAA